MLAINLMPRSALTTPRWLVLKTWRRNLGMSLAAVAKATGVSLTAAHYRERPAAHHRNTPEQNALSNQRNIEARKASKRRYRYSDPAVRLRDLVKGALRRADRYGLDCSRLEEILDVFKNKIPTTCACCSTVLNYSAPIEHWGKESSFPSIDRIDNNCGYTVDNIAVVCFRCNVLKKDATLKDLEMLVAYVRRAPSLKGR